MKIILFLKLFLKKMLLKELLQNLGKYLTNTCSQFIFSRFFQIFLKSELIPMYILISTANISAFNFISYCLLSKEIRESLFHICETLFLRKTLIKPFGKLNFMNFANFPTCESFFHLSLLLQSNSLLKKNKCLT